MADETTMTHCKSLYRIGRNGFKSANQILENDYDTCLRSRCCRSASLGKSQFQMKLTKFTTANAIVLLKQFHSKMARWVFNRYKVFPLRTHYQRTLLIWPNFEGRHLLMAITVPSAQDWSLEPTNKAVQQMQHLQTPLNNDQKLCFILKSSSDASPCYRGTSGSSSILHRQ